MHAPTGWLFGQLLVAGQTEVAGALRQETLLLRVVGVVAGETLTLCNHSVRVRGGVQKPDLRVAGKAEIPSLGNKKGRVVRGVWIVTLSAPPLGERGMLNRSGIRPWKQVRMAGETDLVRLFHQQGGLLRSVRVVADRTIAA
jgi:hypothetical protein